jgi:IS5 family transposase
MKQSSFASLAWETKKKITRREKFLAEMEAVMPWDELLAVIEPHYAKGDRGRPPMGLERMLRIYFMQQWFNLSDPAMEDGLYDSESMRRFAGVDLGDDAVPDETTILNFRRLLETHHLTAKLFARTNRYLEQQGLLVKSGTIVDATIINAPTSTKNESGERDPEMRQTKKGNQWYFGMKVHVGTDRRGVAHSAAVTPASVHDSQVMDDLVHGKEKTVFGDQAYAGRARQTEYRARGVRWGVATKAPPGRRLTERERERNRRLSSVRAMGERPFLVMKHLWGHTKTRYRGLYKNAVQFFMLLTLSNLYLLRRALAT